MYSSEQEQIRERETIIIDPKDMFRQLLRRWTWIALGILVGILFGSAAYLYSKHSVLLPEKKIEETRRVLSDNSALKVEKSFRQYLGYYNSRNVLIDYSNHSLLMKIDPLKVPTRTISFLVSTNSAAEADIISTMTLTEEDYISIATQMGDKNLSPYISELIDFDTDFYITGITMDESQDEQKAQVITNKEYCLTVKIIADSEVHTEQIWKVVENAIGREEKILQKNNPKFELNQTGNIYTETANNEVRKLQVEKVDDLSLITTNLNQMSNASNLNKKEKAYLDALIANNEKADERDNLYLSKYLIVGGGIGFIIVAGIFILIYILEGQIHSTKNFLLTESCVIQEIALTMRNRRKRDHDLDLNKWKYNPDEINLALIKISAICDSSGIKSLYFYSDIKETWLIQLMDVIKRELESRGIILQCGSPSFSSLAMQNFLKTQGMVYLAVLHKSKIDNYCDALNLCQNYGVNFLGSIVISI